MKKKWQMPVWMIPYRDLMIAYAQTITRTTFLQHVHSAIEYVFADRFVRPNEE